MIYQRPDTPSSPHTHGSGEAEDEYPGAPPRPRRAVPRGPRPRHHVAWSWAAVAVAVGGALVAVVAVAGGGQSKAGAGSGGLVTRFMPGEIQQVPPACGAVPGTVLDDYLPGRSRPAAAQPLEGKAATQCSWSVDRPGTYRFMEVTEEAYGPSGLATGNGSATQAAQDAFAAAKAAKQFPPRGSQDPRATVATVSGLGTEAFSARQQFRRGAVLDMVTLVARYRNVVVTVVFEARAGAGLGADPVSLLVAGAHAGARSAVAKLG